MFLILTSILVVSAQDHLYNQENKIWYTPYGESNQLFGQSYGQPYSQPNYGQNIRPQYSPQFGQQFGQYGNQHGPQYNQPLPQPPRARSLTPVDTELNAKIGRETGVPIEAEPTGVDSQQPPNEAVPEAPCDKPGSEYMPLEVLCSLPPHKGSGDDDIFRYYYNPVVQQCIPFSYSGKGGNANRFVSVKNCYEICHPADPTVKKPRVVSGIKAYLVPNLKSDCQKSERNMAFDRKKSHREQPKEVVIRQIPHPLDPTKTLTIIQNAQYIHQSELGGTANKGIASSNDPVDTNVRRLYQYETVPQFIPNLR